ncbi:MAG: integral rane protein [Frankiales bacterium]|nr:integral rane protein [Frankiales bacterium]
MERLFLTLCTIVFCTVGYSLMARGWRSRLRRQSDVAPPPVSDGTAHVLVDWVPGLYVGTTAAGDWLDRIAVHHLSDRATGELCLAEDGVHVLRDGLPEVFVPRADLRGVTVEQSLAGKVVSTGMLVLTWQLGDRELATAFRADDPAAHPRLRIAVTEALLEAA